jgi:hypothetical protein
LKSNLESLPAPALFTKSAASAADFMNNAPYGPTPRRQSVEGYGAAARPSIAPPSASGDPARFIHESVSRIREQSGLGAIPLG